MTTLACGEPMRNPQVHHDRIDSLAFYVAGLHRLSTVQKMVLLLVADCHGRSPPGTFQPSLLALGRMCGCSRKTAWRALQGLGGHHGWILPDWRGGQKSNVYLPGWRLKRIIQRCRRASR